MSASGVGAVAAHGNLQEGTAQRQQLYATVRRYEGVTDPAEAARVVNENFVDRLTELPGFTAYYWVDAGGGVMISTTVYESQAAAEESNRVAASIAGNQMAALLPNPPQITAGSVVVYRKR